MMNLSAYAGQWIAIDEQNTVLAHGDSAATVIHQAEQEHPDTEWVLKKIPTSAMHVI